MFANSGQNDGWPLKIILIAVLALVSALPAEASPYRLKAVLTDSVGTPQEFITWRIFTEEADSAAKKKMAQIPKEYLSQLPPEYLEQMAPKPLTGNVTDADGVVDITLKAPGRYRLNITSLETANRDINFEVSDAAPVADMGEIVLGPGQENLNEVVVTAMRPLVVKEIDRIGYDVSADTESKTSMLDQILRKVPLVSVDPDGTIRVKGSTNFKIYKNGRPNKGYSNNAKEIFKAIPASSIKKIEVITDPGSREDADSGLAILNIITDSSASMAGVMGTVSLRTDTRTPMPMPNLYLTTQVKKLTMTLYGGMWKHNRRSSRSNTKGEELIIPTGIRRLTESNSESSSLGGYGGLELSLDIDTLNLITAEFNMFSYKNKTWTDGTTSQFLPDGTPDYSYSSASRNPSRDRSLNIDGSVNYQHSTRRKGETITLSYMISNNKSHNESDIEYSDLVNAPMPYSGYYSDIDQTSLEQTFQLDWGRPINDKIKFDLGGKFILRNNDADNTLTYTGAPAMDSDDHFSHTTSIGAAYTDWRGKWGKFGARAGIRYEFSRMSRKYHDPDRQNYHSDFNDWVPNIALSYDFSDAITLKASYGRRISRPGISMLDPTVVTTPTTVSQGNPDLASCYYNNYGLEFNFTKSMYNVGLNLGYTTSNDGFLQVEHVVGDVLHSNYENAGKSRRLEAGLFSQLMFGKTMIFFNGNWALAKEEDPTRNLSMTRPEYNAMLFIRQQLPYKIYIHGGGGYFSGSGSSIYGYNKMLNTGVFNFLGLQKSFLKEDRLTLGLQITQPFGPYKRTKTGFYRTRGDIQGTTFTNMTNRFSVGLHVSFRFGSLRASVKKTKASINNDDVEKKSSGNNSQDSTTGGLKMN